jgi:hypothetical protein
MKAKNDNWSGWKKKHKYYRLAETVVTLTEIKPNLLKKIPNKSIKNWTFEWGHKISNTYVHKYTLNKGIVILYM